MRQHEVFRLITMLSELHDYDVTAREQLGGTSESLYLVHA
jgi:hypothetical protein